MQTLPPEIQQIILNYNYNEPQELRGIKNLIRCYKSQDRYSLLETSKRYEFTTNYCFVCRYKLPEEYPIHIMTPQARRCELCRKKRRIINSLKIYHFEGFIP